MLKEFAWNYFERTGNVDFYMFFREIEEKNRGISNSGFVGGEAAISNSIENAVPV